METTVRRDRMAVLLAALAVVLAGPRLHAAGTNTRQDARREASVVTPLTLQVPDAPDSREPARRGPVGPSASDVARWADACIGAGQRARKGTAPGISAVEGSRGEGIARFEAAYRSANDAGRHVGKLGALFRSDLVIYAAGGWRPHLDLGGEAFVAFGHWSFALDRRYRRNLGDKRLAFLEGEGRSRALLVTLAPRPGCEVFERLRWWETARFHRELLLLFFACVLSLVLTPALAALEVSGATGSPAGRPAVLRPLALRGERPRGVRRARLVLVVVAAVDLLFLVLLAW